MEDYYTIEEVARKLRVTRTTVYRWMQSGALRYVMAGERRRIPQSALNSFLKDGKAEDVGENAEERFSPALAYA